MSVVRQAVDKLSATTTAAAVAAAKRTGTGSSGRAGQLADQFRSVLCVLIGILLQSVISWMFGNRSLH